MHRQHDRGRLGSRRIVPQHIYHRPVVAGYYAACCIGRYHPVIGFPPVIVSGIGAVRVGARQGIACYVYPCAVLYHGYAFYWAGAIGCKYAHPVYR